jgi:hypothetical protein
MLRKGRISQILGVRSSLRAKYRTASLPPGSSLAILGVFYIYVAKREHVDSKPRENRSSDEFLKSFVSSNLRAAF